MGLLAILQKQIIMLLKQNFIKKQHTKNRIFVASFKIIK